MAKGQAKGGSGDNWIKVLRVSLGLTQDKFAELIGVPDRSMVGKWEVGINSPNSEYTRALESLRNKRQVPVVKTPDALDAGARENNNMEKDLIALFRQLSGVEQAHLIVSLDEKIRHKDVVARASGDSGKQEAAAQKKG